NHDKGTHFFPWIAAGTTGRVDFIWLSTPDLSPSDAALSPWTAIFGQTTNGTSATPSFSQTSASNKVMHVGGICTDGIFCSVSGATWRIRFPSQSIVAAPLPWFGRIKAVSSMARHISPMDVSSQGNLLWRERNVTLAAKARPVLRPNNGEDQMRY